MTVTLDMHFITLILQTFSDQLTYSLNKQIYSLNKYGLSLECSKVKSREYFN